MVSYVTLAEFAEWLKHDTGRAHTANNDLLTRALNAAGLKIDRLCDRRFAPSGDSQTWRHYLSPDTGLARPLLLIQDAVTITRVEDAGELVPAAEYTEVREEADHPISSLRRVTEDGDREGCWRGPWVDVTGTFGWAAPDSTDSTLSVAPDDIKLAQLVEAYRFYKLRQLPFGQDDGMGGVVPMPKYLPAVMDLIADYRRKAPGGVQRPVQIA